jgi:hypothetical protein
MCTYRVVVVAACQQPKFARKYCFKASAQVFRVSSSLTPLGTFFAYDKKPSVTRDVERAADAFCEAFGDHAVREESSLVFLAECPVELTDEVFYQSQIQKITDPQKTDE